MPTSGNNEWFDEIHRQLNSPEFYEAVRGSLNGHTSDGRIVCWRCGYDRPAHIEKCRSCQLFKDHAGTVGDAKKFYEAFTSVLNGGGGYNLFYVNGKQVTAEEFWSRQRRIGYRAWRRETQREDRAEVRALLNSIPGVRHE